MLKNQWGPDVAFQIAAVNDREPVAAEDELVILAAPDPQSALHAEGSCDNVLLGARIVSMPSFTAAACSLMRAFHWSHQP